MIDYPAVRARADAATPGPWEHVDHVVNTIRQDDLTFMGCGSVITMHEDLVGGDIAAPSGDCYPRSGYAPWEDMAFIAAARTDLPALLDVIDELRALCEDQRAEARDGGRTDVDTLWPSQILEVLDRDR